MKIFTRWKFASRNPAFLLKLRMNLHYWVCISSLLKATKVLGCVVDVTNQGGQEHADEEVEATHDVLGHEWSLKLEKSWSGADPKRRGAPTNQHRLPPPAATIRGVQQEVEFWIIFCDRAKPWSMYEFFIAGIMKKSTIFFNNIYDAENSNGNILANNAAAKKK